MKTRGQDLYESIIGQSYNRWPMFIDQAMTEAVPPQPAPTWEKLPDENKLFFEQAATAFIGRMSGE